MLKTWLNDINLRHTAHIILGLVTILILLTFRNYGVTWDEELQSQYGLAIVDYYFSGFRDDRYAEIFNLYLYGGMFDGLASLVDRFTPFIVYETRHLLNALFGLLGLWGVWRLGRLIGGNVIGLLALILLTLTPVYYGHMFNNPKDIPFAVGIIWSIYFMGRCMAAWPQPKWSLIFKLGLVLGLTLGVRVGAVMLLAFWLMTLGIGALEPFWHQYRVANLKKSFQDIGRYSWRLILPATVIAYIVMLICWPWAQHDPFLNPWRAVSEFSNFPQDVEVLLGGTIYRSTELPRTYIPLYFLIQLPELLLGLTFASVCLMPWIMKRLNHYQRQTVLLILLMAFMPLIFVLIHHSALYDAARHFLFVVPLICLLAALAARYIFLWAVAAFEQAWSKQVIASGLFAIFLISMITQIFIMKQLHPYEYIYANSLTRGVSGAYRKYELDYWGTSFKEAAEELQKFVNKEGGIPPGKMYRVAICGPWSAATIYLPPDYDAVIANEPAEFFLATTRWQCQDMRPGQEIIRIERMGAPLAIVKDLRNGYENYEGNKR
ncbi:MAG: glycosyltransferase family 39 protein [Alphaproteobacteria bacterium]